MKRHYESPQHGHVVDIGGSSMFSNVGERLLECLLNAQSMSSATPTLPDELLYTDRGLRIWNEIIFGAEFYQTHDEIALFDTYGTDLADRLRPGVTLIDLGAGDTRKVEHLLQALEQAQVEATYLALDISKASLQHNVGYLVAKHPVENCKVKCAGLWGTFEDGLRYVQTIPGPKLFLSLGSVLCNDPFPTALNHLRCWAQQLRPEDLLLIGMDAHLAPEYQGKIWDAYHTRPDLYEAFFRDGFRYANELTREPWYIEEDWEFLAELETVPSTRHRFYFKARRDVAISSMDIIIPRDTELDWFDSHKWAEKDVVTMCHKAGLTEVDVWQAPFHRAISRQS